MSAPSVTGRLQIGGASLVYQKIEAAGGGSMPFVFQHGMGGDANQPLGYVGDAPPIPVISLNARGHAPSSDIDPAAATFDTFADGVIALAEPRRSPTEASTTRLKMCGSSQRLGARTDRGFG